MGSEPGWIAARSEESSSGGLMVWGRDRWGKSKDMEHRFVRRFDGVVPVGNRGKLDPPILYWSDGSPGIPKFTGVVSLTIQNRLAPLLTYWKQSWRRDGSVPDYSHPCQTGDRL